MTPVGIHDSAWIFERKSVYLGPILEKGVDSDDSLATLKNKNWPWCMGPCACFDQKCMIT